MIRTDVYNNQLVIQESSLESSFLTGVLMKTAGFENEPPLFYCSVSALGCREVGFIGKHGQNS
jgi:hypothetical protein